MAVVQKLPGAKAPHVSVPDGGARIQPQRGAPVGVGGKVACREVEQRAGHPEVHNERPAALQPPQEVLAASLDGRDPLTHERIRHEARRDGPRQPGVGDLGARDGRAFDERRDPAADGLDLGQLGHGRIVRTTTRASGSMRPEPPFAGRVIRTARMRVARGFALDLASIGVCGRARDRRDDELHPGREDDLGVDIVTVTSHAPPPRSPRHQTWSSGSADGIDPYSCGTAFHTRRRSTILR